ncbi:MAG: hypothetical protein IKP28_01340 [Clostridia bacterium]|nr:hypothetical protein [Clostridia bacterium]
MIFKTKENGITLIALVITVIVLLILAGTAISLSVSGDGLFTKVNTTKEKHNEKVVEEEQGIRNAMDILEIVSPTSGAVYYNNAKIADSFEIELITQGEDEIVGITNTVFTKQNGYMATVTITPSSRLAISFTAFVETDAETGDSRVSTGSAQATLDGNAIDINDIEVIGAEDWFNLGDEYRYLVESMDTASLLNIIANASN